MIQSHPMPILVRLQLALLVTVSLVTASLSYANPMVTSDHVQAWVNEYVVPSYVALHQANQALQRQAHQLCDQVSLQALNKMQPYLNQALQALAYSQAINGGPVQEQLRNFHLYYWPDRTNLVTKHLSQLLDQPSSLGWQQYDLSQSSIAITGYPALERLLYVPRYRQLVMLGKQGPACRYMVALSDNLLRLTTEITDAWQVNWRQQLVGPRDGSSMFKDQNDKNTFVFTNIDTLLTKIINQKLAKALTSRVSSAKPKRLESWRSSQSVIMLKANAKGLTDSLNLTLKPALIDANEEAKWDTIRLKLSFINQLIEQLPTPLMVSLDEPKYWLATQELRNQFIQLQGLLQEIYPSLNVQLGFNAYDGD
jgi:predicted lipoprotein